VRRLSGLDAGFLVLETDRAPMTIASLSILDSSSASAPLSVERLRNLLRERLDRAPALRRRLVALPLGLTRPYWTELAPEEIDLEQHVEHTTLPAPGGWHELRELVAWEIAQPLDRSRPLWHLLLVSGLEGVDGVPKGSVGLIARVHHAAIDGVSGAEILAALCEGGAEPTTRAAPTDAPSFRAGRGGLLRKVGGDLLAAPQEASRAAGRALAALTDAARRRLKERAAREAESAGVPPPLPFRAPRSALNRPLSGRRAWAPALFHLSAVKAVRAAQDATVNDVLLAVCAGALRSWLEERNALPPEPLVAMVPVSVRAESERGDAGNLVSAMLVSLATDEADSKTRLARICAATRSSKVAHRAVGARTLLESAQLAPFALSGLAARLYSRLHLAERHRPMFNLVITNVPGPSEELRVGGARMVAHLPAGPLFDGLGLILPIFSYAGRVAIGVTADRVVMPDAVDFARRLEAAFEELAARCIGSRDGTGPPAGGQTDGVRKA
jgi:WS/DGAT/MGAT family acyltransferase